MWSSCLYTHCYPGIVVSCRVFGCKKVHGNLYIVKCQSWGIGGVVWSSLLLQLPLLLVLLGVCSPAAWLELVSVLSKGVIEQSRVWESSSGLDEFNHLSPLGDFHCFGLVFAIGHVERCPCDLI
jgi:hypothetical protein